MTLDEMDDCLVVLQEGGGYKGGGKGKGKKTVLGIRVRCPLCVRVCVRTSPLFCCLHFLLSLPSTDIERKQKQKRKEKKPVIQQPRR